MTDSPSSSDQDLLDPRDAFAELGRTVLGAEPLTVVLERVAGLAKRTVPKLAEVSVTMLADGKPRTVAFTGRLAVDLDERQYEAGFGPCTDAAISGQVIVVDAHDPATSYPGFAAACRRAGIAHVVSLGLPVAGRVVGGLNMYAITTEPIPTGSVELAEAFAGYAGAAVANAGQYQATTDLLAQMHTAIASRGVIEQAKGILIERSGCTEKEAFTVLTRASQNSNRKLRDIALKLVTDAQSKRT